ncbi:cyclic pyranopterin monophosphate synthase MoaC [Marinicella sediminis]|uniref:cyclic pyranopterin monophosphate synthase n=1 Tax=Marinicella sediminis TaxID=1792834 RepID=A0ABV7J8S4_9GAMM|nr:cyclic pyranopterin monophosphate synthase MoaC [Marinicella sediminis]
MSREFTHIDANNQPTMVDVGDKQVTSRTARARCIIELPDPVRQAMENDEIQSKKGPVFQTAIIAGVMAAKKTHELIPFCHPIGMEHCTISIRPNADRNLEVTCECRITAKTGIEMEALTGCSVAALTVYDMCKALSHDIVIRETRLIHKTGGKSDFQAP